MPDLIPSEEMELWKELKDSAIWELFLELAEARRKYLDEQMRSCLRKGDDRKAAEWLARMDEVGYIFENLINNRKKKVKDEGNVNS